MSASPSPPRPPGALVPEVLRRARARAILLVLAAAAAFSLAGACVKALGGTVPLAEVVFFRNAFAIPALLPLMLRHGGLAALRTSHPLSHAARTLFGLLGMFGSFYGLAHLPFAVVSALGFTMPLFLAMLSVPLLGERVGWRRSAAVAVGFLGVLLIVRPGAEGAASLDLFAAGAVLLGAVGWALAMITIRRMGEAGEQGVTIVLWFAIGSSLAAAVAAIPVWVWPTPGQWLLLAGVGLVSALAQVMMTNAYRTGESTLLAPFEYSAIVWTVAMGAVLWGELPDPWDAAGIAVLIGSGLYIWHREVTLSQVVAKPGNLG
ncbi:DMT family transporter [Caldovatus aquaticus]|uniref:DMT family transporter n=1 Tax=Caldovatus aquaticus TaxID=2865671 RepID=A0ABS7EZX5_9PROT|nr:DMT family transporter [Caldovatus aquaticus]MBW8268633.1 DMT family transporter [Caldovatus aquaticus]